MAIIEPKNYKDLDYPKGPQYFPHHVAFVIDGIVEEILHLQDPLFELLSGIFTTRQVENDSATVYRVEILVDDDVKETLNVSERVASILLSNPKVISFNLNDNLNLEIKDLYNETTSTFSKPVVE
jgi:hypothetical protein